MSSSRVSVCHRLKTLGIELTLVVLLILNVSSFLPCSYSLIVLHTSLIIIFLVFVIYHILIAVVNDDRVTLGAITRMKLNPDQRTPTKSSGEWTGNSKFSVPERN
ncbi:MAG: hypothetical protein CME33_00155 [Gimesia sp.]|nr:hypothetical protein [Gimesia sp.]